MLKLKIQYWHWLNSTHFSSLTKINKVFFVILWQIKLRFKFHSFTALQQAEVEVELELDSICHVLQGKQTHESIMHLTQSKSVWKYLGLHFCKKRRFVLVQSAKHFYQSSSWENRILVIPFQMIARDPQYVFRIKDGSNGGKRTWDARSV